MNIVLSPTLVTQHCFPNTALSRRFYCMGERFDIPEQSLNAIVHVLRDSRTPEHQAHQAFAELFAAYGERLVLFANRYLHSLDRAQDVVHDVFLWIWENRHALPRDTIQAYLFRATRNRALNLIDHDAVIAQWEAYVQLQYGESPPSEANEGERQLETAELQEQVNRALQQLSPRVREIVRLNREEHLKPGEIADILGLAPATVYSQLSRALRALNQALFGKDSVG